MLQQTNVLMFRMRQQARGSEPLTMSNTNHTERLWSYWRRRCNHPLCRPFPHLYYWDSSKRKQICWDPWDHRCTAWCLNCQQKDSCVHFSYFQHNRHKIRKHFGLLRTLKGSHKRFPNVSSKEETQRILYSNKSNHYTYRTNQIASLLVANFNKETAHHYNSASHKPRNGRPSTTIKLRHPPPSYYESGNFL